MEEYFHQDDISSIFFFQYSAGEKLEGSSTTPYTPTRYNFVTGEVMVETQVKERQEIMRKAREAASDADDIYKRTIDFATKNAIIGDFALAYILLWKLYRIAPYIFDLPLCMEQCLTKLWPTTGLKDILKAATSCVQYLPQGNEYSPMFHKILFSSPALFCHTQDADNLLLFRDGKDCKKECL
jgi:hypothetical protein